MKCIVQKFNPTENDPIAVHLDAVGGWLIYGHLTFGMAYQHSEALRLKKFHLLIRDAAKRFTGKRDLDGLGWFLRQEGNGREKLYHFHFALTKTNIRADAAIVSIFLRKQWGKIAGTQCDIRPWNEALAERGILYVTKLPPYSVPESNYFHGAPCHWKISNALRAQMLLADETESSPKRVNNELNSTTIAEQRTGVSIHVPRGSDR